MESVKTFLASENFPYIAFLVAILLILGAWKFGIDGLME